MAEKLTVGMAAGPITRSATGSALALALGPTMTCTPSISTRRRAAATAFSGSAVASPMATATGKPNTPPPSLTCLIASSNARRLSLWTSVEPLLMFISSPILSAAGSSARAAPGAATAPISAMAAAPGNTRIARAPSEAPSRNLRIMAMPSSPSCGRGNRRSSDGPGRRRRDRRDVEKTNRV